MKTFKKRFYSLAILLLFYSCIDKADPGESSDPLKLNIFNVPDGSGVNSLQSTLQAEENLHIAFFGFENGVNSLLIADQSEDNESVILLDENQNPAFAYKVNSQTGEKEGGLVEFEPIQPGSFFMRFYHYDWGQRIGTLIAETKVTRSSGDWDIETIFVTSNTQMEGVSSRRTSKGGSFYRPINRLDDLRLRKSEALRTQDQVGGFLDFIDNFRNQDVPTFFREKIQPYSDLATLIGGIGVLVGAPAFAPIFIGGAAISAATRAINFFQSDRFESFLDNVRNARSNFSDGLNTLSGGAVEILNDYTGSASEFWNDLRGSFTPEDSLEEILRRLEEQEVINENENLDDLPDSQGVIQVGLSWNTASTDIDLWVTDPFGERIYYLNPQSSSGGYLDRDDVDGFGPENIYWQDGAPDGDYLIVTDYFGCFSDVCPATSYQVKVSNGLGIVRTFEGTLAGENSQDFVITFTKQGTDLIF